MALEAVERHHNVVRYVGGASFDRHTGVVDASAFERKPKDTDGLSFTVRGVFEADEAADLTAIRAVLGSRMKIGKTACLAELNVGSALDCLAEFGDFFSFQPDPLDAEADALANPAHSLLMGLPFKGEAVGSLKSEYAGDLLRRQIIARHPAVVE